MDTKFWWIVVKTMPALSFWSRPNTVRLMRAPELQGMERSLPVRERAGASLIFNGGESVVLWIDTCHIVSCRWVSSSAEDLPGICETRGRHRSRVAMTVSTYPLAAWEQIGAVLQVIKYMM